MRTLGTFLGLVIGHCFVNAYAVFLHIDRTLPCLGLLIWYIGESPYSLRGIARPYLVRLPQGNGTSNGNPYGTAAAWGVFVIPILFARLFAPPAILQPLILFAVRFPLTKLEQVINFILIGDAVTHRRIQLD